MKTTPFSHDYKSPTTAEQTTEIIGYSKALTALLRRLEELTEGNPEKRMIDACDLLDSIVATNNQLQAIQRNTLTVLTEKMKDGAASA